MQKFVNLYQTQLSAAAASGDTTVYVNDVPSLALAMGDYFIACLESVASQAVEIVKVTAFNVQANSLTLVRGLESTSPLAFVAGDKLEIRLTAGTCDEFFQRTELATVEQAKTGTGDTQVMTPAKVKAALDWGLPVGAIIAWNPGFYGDGANGEFAVALIGVNSVAAANVYLNSRGWFVCDGAVVQPNYELNGINVSGTLIWNTPSRFLPNLTGNRFLMGGGGGGQTAVGTPGGSNIMADHRHACSTTDINHKHFTDPGSVGSGGESGQHVHHTLYNGGGSYSPAFTVGGASHMIDGAPFAESGPNTAGHYHGVDVGSTLSDLMTVNQTHGHNIGTGGAPDVAGLSIDNRPKFLSTYFIIKVF